jgi:hypothetical protein
MSDSIFEVEYRPGEEIVLRFKPSGALGLSKTTRQHLRTAQKEALLALRAILDGVIERTAESAKKEPAKKRTKIKVQ